MSRRVQAALVAGVALLVMVGAALVRSGPEAGSSLEVNATSTTTTIAPGIDEASTRAMADDDPTDGQTDESVVVAAAIDLAVAPQAWLYLSDEELDSAIRSISTPASADRLVDEITSEVGLARDALARSPGRIWWVVSPLAWRLESLSGDRAQVSVWTVSVLSAADVAMPQSDWTMTLLDLDWDGDAWKLVATRDTPGPTPQLGGRDEAWQPEPFDDALDAFVRVGADPS